jgi:hypothetical protein
LLLVSFRFAAPGERGHAAAELKAIKATKLGNVDSKLLIRLTAFVEKTPVLSQEDKDAIVDGLAD